MIKRLQWLWFMIVCFVIISISQTTAAQEPEPTLDDLHFITEELPPLHYVDSEGHKTGIVIEIMEWLFKELDIKKRRQDIQFLPWARAYMHLLQRPNTALFTTSYLEERIPLFRWVGPIMPYNNLLIVKRSSKINISNDSDLLNYRIGAVRDTMDQLSIMEHGVPHEQLTLVTFPKQLIQMLNIDRIDAFVYSEDIGKYLIMQQGGQIDDYDFIYELKQVQLYLAVNKSVPETVIQQLQAGLDRIKKEPRYQAIIDRYLEERYLEPAATEHKKNQQPAGH